LAAVVQTKDVSQQHPLQQLDVLAPQNALSAKQAGPDCACPAVGATMLFTSTPLPAAAAPARASFRNTSRREASPSAARNSAAVMPESACASFRSVS
jgi:hypothetical protein